MVAPNVRRRRMLARAVEIAIESATPIAQAEVKKTPLPAAQTIEPVETKRVTPVTVNKKNKKSPGSTTAKTIANSSKKSVKKSTYKPTIKAD